MAENCVKHEKDKVEKELQVCGKKCAYTGECNNQKSENSVCFSDCQLECHSTRSSAIATQDCITTECVDRCEVMYFCPVCMTDCMSHVLAGVEFKAKERKNSRPKSMGLKEEQFNEQLSQDMLYDWVDSGSEEDEDLIMARSFVEGGELSEEEKKLQEEAEEARK